MPPPQRPSLPVPSPRACRATLAGVVLLYLAVMPLSNGDMRNHLLPWTQYILTHGRIDAMADRFSEYTPPYLYLLSFATLLDGVLNEIAIVKAVAIAGTLFLASAMRLLLGRFMPAREAWAGAGATLLLPSVVANGPVWGQCDALWSGCIVLFVWAVVGGRMAMAAALLGLAVAFKLQAVFVAPLVLALLLAGRLRWWLLVLAPLTYMLAMLPACLAGRPVEDVALIYLLQGEYFRDLARSVPNIWQILRALVRIPYEIGVIAGLGITAAAVVALAWKKRRAVLTAEGVLLTALAAGIMVPYLLPKMHNRYFFLADVMALAWLLVRRSRRAAWICALTQTGSLLAYATFLLKLTGGAFVGAFAMTAALLLVWRELRDAPFGVPALGPSADRGPGSSANSAGRSPSCPLPARPA